MIHAGTSETPQRRPPAKSERVRLAILQAAAELFGQRGYDATGIREIEAAAGVSRGLVTYHLGNKEDVWKEAILFTFLPFLQELRSMKGFLKALSPEVRIRHMIAHFVRTSARKPHMNRLMIQEGFARSWRSEFIIRRVLSPVRELSKDLGDDSEIIRLVENDPHVRYALLGACNMVFSLPTEVAAIYGQDVYSDAFIDRHINTVVSIVESFSPGRREEKPAS